MGLIRTASRFCYIECDHWNCTKKMEHIDEKLLGQLARLCGWERKDNRWICPSCAETPIEGPARPLRSRQKTQIRPKR
jgi:hypothetical protein